MESWKVTAKNLDYGKEGEVGKRCKRTVIRWIRFEDLGCNMVTIVVNTTVYLRFAKRTELKCSYKRKNTYTRDDGCVNYHDGGNPFTM